ncbi:hypothetical protein MCEL_46970 [Mycolicibacterium celeriflavum]|uniref:ATP-dependent Clp protease adapter protein ClpS n=2 Tax=Mycobacteriaceae TaxID=1762 RepID=A0A7I7RP96_MYCCF|nr:hypothetical protein MCEL_46970 [Mycolicibacterium celeriflavum]
MGGAVPQRGREHRQLVFVGEQGRGCGGHTATVVARSDGSALAILNNMVTPAKARPKTRKERDVKSVAEEDAATDTPWVTIVWDDPVNLMTYVTYVFQKLFGYPEPHATKLMLQVHNEGKAVVSAGSRESMEVDVSKLHAAGLWATMQQDR